MDIAALGFEVDSSQARGAAKALADLNSAAINAANGAAKFEKTLRGVDGRFRSTNDYLAENIREVEALARAYNPVMAAQIAYRDEVLRTATAVKAGVITEQQRAQILDQTKTRLDQAAAASQRFGQTQTVASHHVANLSFQLNDIGMMMASGQSPFMLMIQQGPQVAQIFSQLKQSGQSLGSALSGAFRMVLNPTTLLTLAVIGGTAALTQWIFKSEDADKKAKTLEDSIGNLNDSISDLQKTSKLLAGNAGLDELTEKYGKVTEQIRAMVTAQRDLDILAARKAQEATQAMIAASIEPGFIARAFDNGRIAITEAEREAVRLQQTTKYLKETLGVTEVSAQGLAQTLSLAFNEKDPEKYADLVGHVRDYLLQVANAGGEGAAAALKLAQELTKSEEASRRAAFSIDAATGATNQWSSAMSGVNAQIQNIARSLAAISGLQIDAASARVEKRLLEMGVKAGDAAKKAMDAATAASFNQRRAQVIAGFAGNYNSPEYKTAIRLLNEEQQAAKAAADAQYELGAARDVAAKAEREAEKKHKSGGGRAAARSAEAELKRAEKGFQSLRELLEKDTLFQFAEYEKRQAQLKAALDKRLVTVQQYQEYEAALRIQYFGTEYQQRQLQYDLELQQLRQALEQQLITRQEYDALMRQRQWEQVSQLGQIRDAGTAYELNQMATAFGEAASMAGDYNQKFLKAQRVFAASAALISTYQGAAKALELPFPMNIAAAAKVIAAGLGFVSAIKSGGSSGGGRGSSSSAASAATKTEPTRQVLVRLEGDDWLVDMAENIMTQIYEQSKDGRVIVARDRS